MRTRERLDILEKRVNALKRHTEKNVTLAHGTDVGLYRTCYNLKTKIEVMKKTVNDLHDKFLKLETTVTTDFTEREDQSVAFETVLTGKELLLLESHQQLADKIRDSVLSALETDD